MRGSENGASPFLFIYVFHLVFACLVGLGSGTKLKALSAAVLIFAHRLVTAAKRAKVACSREALESVVQLGLINNRTLQLTSKGRDEFERRNL